MSIGTGIFPAEDLGSTDAQRFLYFGKHWFKSKTGLFQTVDNLITLLTTAVSLANIVTQSMSHDGEGMMIVLAACSVYS